MVVPETVSLTKKQFEDLLGMIGEYTARDFLIESLGWTYEQATLYIHKVYRMDEALAEVNDYRSPRGDDR
jgi:hypothetical protein